MVDKERLDREIDDFNSTLIPFGYSDVKEAVSSALEGGHDGRWAAEQIEEYMDSTDTKLSEIDPNYVVYDSLLQEARNDINELTDKDILNDTDEQIEVSGNFMCTSLDYSDKASGELVEILKEIDPDDETTAIEWLISEVDIREEVEEARKLNNEEDKEDQ